MTREDFDRQAAYLAIPVLPEGWEFVPWAPEYRPDGAPIRFVARVGRPEPSGFWRARYAEAVVWAHDLDSHFGTFKAKTISAAALTDALRRIEPAM